MNSQQPKFDYHQTVNLVISTLLVATATFLFNINNQMIVLTEKVGVISKSLEDNSIVIDKLSERLRLVELYKVNKQ